MVLKYVYMTTSSCAFGCFVALDYFLVYPCVLCVYDGTLLLIDVQHCPSGVKYIKEMAALVETVPRYIYFYIAQP